jgi:D-amino-acid dehydrogenase
MGDRHLRVVSGAEFAGYDRRIPTGKGGYLLSCLKAVFPDFSGPETVADEDVWCGFRPVPAHGLPIIGDAGTPNFFLNTGHGYMGWTMSAASGSLLADHIVGKEPALPVHEYGLPK